MKDHLKFCNVCVNKNWDLKTGIYCNLTGLKPNFDNNCSNYAYSHNNYLKLIADKKSFYEKILSREISNSQSRTKVEETRKDESHRIHNYAGLDSQFEVFRPIPWKWIWRQPVFTLNDKGISVEGRLIKWNEIIFTSFHTVWGKDENNNERKTHYMVIDGISPESSAKAYLPLSKAKEIGHLIELYKEKYWAVKQPL